MRVARAEQTRVERQPMFDPYHKWLGIPPKDQPPHYYRLLAIDLFESDPEVIDAAANRQMSYVRQRATGERVRVSQRLLNELSVARLCLLDPQKRSAYDAKLRATGEQPDAAAMSPGRRLPIRWRFCGPQHAAAASADANRRATGSRPVGVSGIRPPPLARPRKSSRIWSCTGSRRVRIPAASPGFRQFLKLLLLAGGCLAAAAAMIVLMLSGDARNRSPRRQTRGRRRREEVATSSPRRNPPETGKAAIYNVEIDPPSVTLVVKASGNRVRRRQAAANPHR